MNFYIIYSIDIPFDTNNGNLSIEELENELQSLEIELPDKQQYNEVEYFRELIIALNEYDQNLDPHFHIHIPTYIGLNPDKFRITEEEVTNWEFGMENPTTHRKYVGILNEEEFLNFIYDFTYNSTCNTMGSLTEYGHLEAFSVELCNYDLIENLYISCLFDEEMSDIQMQEIENNIREGIETGEIDKTYFKING